MTDDRKEVWLEVYKLAMVHNDLACPAETAGRAVVDFDEEFVCSDALAAAVAKRVTDEEN